MNSQSTYFILWKGQRSGPYSLADIQRQLAGGQISLWHQVEGHAAGVMTVRDLVEGLQKTQPPQVVVPKHESVLQATRTMDHPPAVHALPALTEAPTIRRPPEFSPPPASQRISMETASVADRVALPEVHIAAINPGTAGFIAAACAAFGLPFFAYIQPGRIARGLVVQLGAWLAYGFAASLICSLFLRSFDESVEISLLIAVAAWFSIVVYTVVDVNHVVKEHNAGRGVSYT